MGKRKGGHLREMTKAQAGKRAAIEKLIEAERKKNEPPKTIAVQPPVRFGPRPVVRLPGQPFYDVSNHQINRPPNNTRGCPRYQQTGRSPYQHNGRPFYPKTGGSAYQPAGFPTWQKTNCPPIQMIPRPINYPVFPPPRPIGRRQISVNLPPPAPALEPVQTISFLELPGELRNKVYAYAFPEEHFSLKWIPETHQKSLTYTLPKRSGKDRDGPQLGASAGRRRRLFDYPRRIRSTEMMAPYSLSPGPAALLLTCKKANDEATELFYASSTFAFSAPGTFKAFLAALRPKSTAAIRSLAIKHYTAGQPSFTDFCAWKAKDDDAWDDLMWEAEGVMKGIERFALDLTINDVPVLFGRGACWKVPYMAWEDMGIKECSVKLRNATTPSAVLEVEAYILRKQILGKEFVEEEQEEKAEVAGRRRRVRVLNLIGDAW